MDVESADQAYCVNLGIVIPFSIIPMLSTMTLPQLLAFGDIEAHYLPWGKARQEQLEQSVRKAWNKSAA